MKKPLKIFLIFVALIITLLLAGSLTKTLLFHRAVSVSNYPTIKKGQTFCAFGLGMPKRFDIICFRADLLFEGRQTIMQRLCGMPGDTIEIRQAVLYVNGKNVDNDLTLSHNYMLSLDEFEKIEDKEDLEEALVTQNRDGSINTYIDDRLVKEKLIKATLQVQPVGKVDEEITKLYGHPWNQDHFGPLIVPANKYFVLGDNRENAADSRYLGFVDKADYVGRVIWKK